MHRSQRETISTSIFRVKFIRTQVSKVSFNFNRSNKHQTAQLALAIIFKKTASRIFKMSLTSKLAITDLQLAGKRVLIRFVPASS